MPSAANDNWLPGHEIDSIAMNQPGLDPGKHRASINNRSANDDESDASSITWYDSDEEAIEKQQQQQQKPMINSSNVVLVKMNRYFWWRVSLFFHNAASRWLLLISLCFVMAMSYVATVAANYASYLSPSIVVLGNSKENSLPDILLDRLPNINKLWLTDLMVDLCYIPVLLFVLFIDRMPVYSFCRFIHCMALGYIVRSLAVFTTSLPDPRPGCQQVSLDRIFTNVSLHRCGDCVFSGHTMMMTFCFLFWLSTSKRSLCSVKKLTENPSSQRLVMALLILMRIESFLAMIAGIMMILLNRAHYTVDVVVAIYVACGLWWSHAYFAKQLIQKWTMRTSSRKNMVNCIV